MPTVCSQVDNIIQVGLAHFIFQQLLATTTVIVNWHYIEMVY